MERLLSALIAFASSLTAIKVENYFSAKSIDDITSLFIALAVAIMVYFLLNYTFLRLPLRFQFLRKLLLKPAMLEGYWYEQIDKSENPYSYACIEYDYDMQSFLYYGKNYDSEMRPHATFRSINMQIQQTGNKIHYYFQAQMHSQGKDERSGYGNITFYKDGTDNFNRGDGYIIDSATGELRKILLNLSKISTKKVKEVVGHAKVESDDDIYNLVKYFKDKPEYNRFLPNKSIQPIATVASIPSASADA